MVLNEYISELNHQFQTGVARELSYRTALQQFISSLLPDMVIINEPARFDFGAPDYIIARRSDNLPTCFIEAKDIGDTDLDGHRQHKEQFNRYKNSLERVIFTDYLNFHFYENGELRLKIRLGEIIGDHIVAISNDFELFIFKIKDFAHSSIHRITSASKLAKLMAGKALLLADAIRKILKDESENYTGNQIQGQYDAFRQVLIHDLSSNDFADIYAQTIAYGMFAARMHDTTPENFSRQEAATLIPKTNPFLRQIFQTIAGYDLDERIAWIVDDLANMFCATDMPRILRGYGSNNRHSDPMIHFYEDFLSSYNSKLRKSKGVWYTPSPVVRFIVKSVDEILKREFGLSMGLADYSKINHKVINEQYNPRARGSHRTNIIKIHKVQILDPATGTGTFLAEVIKCIYGKFANRQGMWQGYVEDHLLPRLNGFELLMAPYAIAHLKLDWLLGHTGYIHNVDRRIRVYLTNSLEEYHKDIGTLFSQWLSREANEASRIKRDTPVMVLIGNPPYNGSSANKGEWIMRLMEDYKKEPDSTRPLDEKNSKWLNDDYVKFIRMSQYFIENNGEGILAFINPHGFLDNPTFRGMRWNLLKTYDAIYTIDLHGNSNRHEIAPDGGIDENVFDIKQGVSINLFIKTGKKKPSELGKLFHFDLYGKRNHKYEFLNANDYSTITYSEIIPAAPMYFFVPKDLELGAEYNEGFAINELFVRNSVGIVTTKDSFLICNDKDTVKKRIRDLITLSEEELRSKYGLTDTRDWSISRAKNDVGDVLNEIKITEIDYRWGDVKFLYYTGLTNGIVAWPRFHSLSQMLSCRNFALLTVRQIAGNEWSHVSVSTRIVDDCRVSNRTKERGYVFPLFINPGEAGSSFDETPNLIPNFNLEIIDKINSSLGENIEPLELFDYIYAVLHSPSYRKRYAEFLKIDFPRIPYPHNSAEYHRLVEIGTKLRDLHTMADSEQWDTFTTYPVNGSNEVKSPTYKDGKIVINDTQYFGNIDERVWEISIGGYKPAQKWLKDRKGQILSHDDLRHYEEIIYALDNTIKLIGEIDI